jgi:integrase
MQYSTIIRKKDKSYQYVITYKVDNKWKTKSKQGFLLNKEGKKRAQEEMDQAVLALKKQFKNNIDSSMSGITFKQFGEKHIEHMKLYREINTVLGINTVLNHFSGLDNIELAKITLLDLQTIIDDMVRTGLSTRVIKVYVERLKSIFLSAKNEYNLITDLPTERLNLKINKDNSEINKRALTKKESDKLLSDFEVKNSQYYLVILIALTCGLRLGEILGLTWDNVDTKNSMLKVTKQWKKINEKQYGFGALKSKNSNREVPIPPKTNIILKNITVKNINGRLFDFKNTESVSICLNRLFKLGGYNITIHELRHTYATTLISNGIDFKTAAKFLGHNVEQTMKTYSHVNSDMIKRATNIIENIF